LYYNPPKWEVAAMFESPIKKQEEPASAKALIAVLVVIALAVVAVVIYKVYSPAPKGSSSASARRAVKPSGPPDAVHDLKILRANMGKDPTGTTAVWSVELENKSNAYTYSNIQYETTYVGANNVALLVNKGTIPISIVPGDSKDSEIRDALYPAGTAVYNFRITGAQSTVQ
jgi:flagellar basal body-associated protein FliL